MQAKYHSPLEGESARGEARLRAGGGQSRRPVSEARGRAGGGQTRRPGGDCRRHALKPFGRRGHHNQHSLGSRSSQSISKEEGHEFS